MAKRNQLTIDFSKLSQFAESLDRLGGDLQQVIDTGLTDAAKKVATDTIAALAPPNLPAKGKYRTGRTEDSAIAESEIRVEWSGPIAEVGLGFDKFKPGAGGFLINGTPRMAPDKALQRIYARKTYSNELVKDMANLLIKEIVKIMNYGG